MTGKRGKLFVGTSGYQYNHWRGVFYPQKLPKKQWFEYYCKFFDTVEINNTFYNLPESETFDQWREEAPPDFCYALKFSRYGSHIKRLKEPADTINNFLDNAAHLREKTGPILVQLPPKWNVNAERLDQFLAAADRDFRWVVEFRDERWLIDEVYEILRKYNTALCIHDLIPDHPDVVTADWTYLRFHGENYGGCYSEQQLREIGGYITKKLEAGLDVYAYFNNDADGYAVQNARDLLTHIA